MWFLLLFRLSFKIIKFLENEVKFCQDSIGATGVVYLCCLISGYVAEFFGHSKHTYIHTQQTHAQSHLLVPLRCTKISESILIQKLLKLNILFSWMLLKLSDKTGYSDWKGSNTVWMRLLWSLVTTGAPNTRVGGLVGFGCWFSLYMTSISNKYFCDGPATGLPCASLKYFYKQPSH